MLKFKYYEGKERIKVVWKLTKQDTYIRMLQLTGEDIVNIIGCLILNSEWCVTLVQCGPLQWTIFHMAIDCLKVWGHVLFCKNGFYFDVWGFSLWRVYSCHSQHIPSLSGEPVAWQLTSCTERHQLHPKRKPCDWCKHQSQNLWC